MIMFAFGIIYANIRYSLLLFEYEDFFFFFFWKRKNWVRDPPKWITLTGV